jgi:hypothetical protein
MRVTTPANPSGQTSKQSAAPAAGAAPAAVLNAPAAGAAPVVTAPPVVSETPDPAAPAAAVPGSEPAQGEPAGAVVPPAGADPAAAVPADPNAPKLGADGKPVADAAQPAAGIPEAYVFPTIEGVELRSEALTAMSPAFKEAGLTQAQVDTLAKTFVTYQQSLAPAMLQADLEVTMKDKSLGGMNWGRTQGYVNDALAGFTTKEFRQQLEKWGIANNLEFVRVFERIGKAMRGDTPGKGAPTSANEESTADRIYGRAKKVGQ